MLATLWGRNDQAWLTLEKPRLQQGKGFSKATLHQVTELVLNLGGLAPTAVSSRIGC